MLQEPSYSTSNIIKPYHFRQLDIVSQELINHVITAAKQIFKTPKAQVSLISEDKQYFWAYHSDGIEQIYSSMAFCTHVLAIDDVLVIPDALQDPRFASNLLVAGESSLRFYAGAPLITTKKHRIGTFCVLDTTAHLELTHAERMVLHSLLFKSRKKSC